MLSRHCEPSGLAFGEPKDKLREAISATLNEQAKRDCFASLAMTTGGHLSLAGSYSTFLNWPVMVSALPVWFLALAWKVPAMVLWTGS